MSEKTESFLQTVSRAMAIRLDSWTNTQTGLGTSRDRASATAFAAPSFWSLDEVTLSAMFANEDLSAKIVEIYPIEELREGFTIDNLDDSEKDDVADYLDGFNVAATMIEARTWGRLYGGAVIWVGVNDGPDPSQPMGEFQRVDFMRVVDRRFVNPIWASADATGMPQIYRVTPMTAPQQYADVHVSRLVRFGGARTEARMKRWLNGWDFSVLQRPYDALRGNGAMWQSVETMMSEATQSVFKMKGLFAKMASTLRTEILDRISVMDQTRSTSRAIVLDAEGEEFERSSLAFAGVADVSDRGIKRVAAAAEIPVTVLLGESPAGLNATGDSDLRWFLMRVAARRQFDCEPQLRRLLGILLRARSSPIAAQVVGGWRPKIGWPPLWTPNAVELSTIKLQTAQRDQLYITEGVFEPEEVALTRGGPSGFAGDVALSDDAIAAREDLLATTLANFSEPTPVPNVPGQAPPPPVPGHTAPVAPNSPVAPDAPPKAVP